MGNRSTCRHNSTTTGVTEMRLPSIRHVVLATAVAVTGVIGVTTSPAFASDVCGAKCNNENPNTYTFHPPGGPSKWWHCGGDAKTVDSLGPGDNAVLRQFGVTLQLRYSPRCRTVWARAYGLQRSDTLIVKIFGPGGSQENSNDSEYGESPDYQGEPGAMWSPMMNDAGHTAVACFTPRAHSGSQRVCTKNPY
jgi:hypothetical protein